MVLLPAPLMPTKATFSPGWIVNETCLRIGGPPGYAKETLRNSMCGGAIFFERVHATRLFDQLRKAMSSKYGWIKRFFVELPYL